MQVKFSNKGSTLVVQITGELDHHSIEYIREKIDAEMMKSTTRNMVLDFSKVSFMDSSGIGVVMGRYKNIRNLNGNMALIHVSPQIRRILDMSGVLRLISVYDTLEDAIKGM